jgi:hypothetical protein
MSSSLSLVPPPVNSKIPPILIITGHACGHLSGLTVVRAAAGKQRLFNPSEELRAF